MNIINIMGKLLKHTGLVAGLAGLVFFAAAASAETWRPERNVGWVVVYGVGGGFDSYSRSMVAAMPKYMDADVNILVKNVTGAASINGTIHAYRSKPDGYTLAAIDPTSAIPYQLLKGQKESRFDIRKFVPVAFYNREPYVLWAGADSGIRKVEDLKSRRLRFGVTGPDSSFFPDVGAIEALGLDAAFVSGYKSLGNVVTGVVRGDVDVMSRPLSAQNKHYKKGQVVPLAVFSKEREKRLPDTPAITEFDLKGPPPIFDIVRVIVLPPGTPDAVADYWESVIVKTLRGKEVQKWSKDTGRMVNVGGRAEAKAAMEGLFTAYGAYMPASQKWIATLSQ